MTNSRACEISLGNEFGDVTVTVHGSRVKIFENGGIETTVGDLVQIYRKPNHNSFDEKIALDEQILAAQLYRAAENESEINEWPDNQRYSGYPGGGNAPSERDFEI